MNIYTTIGAIVLVSAALGTSYMKGYQNGKNYTQVAWDAEKLTIKNAQIKTIIENEKKNRATQEAHNKTNRRVENSTNTRFNALRRDYHSARDASSDFNGLRDNYANPSIRMPSSPASACSNNATTTSPGELSREAQEELWNVYEEADRLVEQMRAAQDWVKESGLYGKEIDKE